MWTMNLGKPTNMPQLSESMAIDLGSQILGEAVIFFVAAFLICVEYSRQSHNEERKEEMAKEELYKLDYKIQELECQLTKQTSLIQRLHFAVHELRGEKICLSDGSEFSKTPQIKPLNRPSDNDLTQNKNDEGLVTNSTSMTTPSEESNDYYSILMTMP